MEIKDYCKQAYETAKNNGFHEDEGYNLQNIPKHLMLIVGELVEALEADRQNLHFSFDQKKLEIFNHIDGEERFKIFIEMTHKYFEFEIADTFIRLFDLCGAMNIDIEPFIKAKMEYNKTREYKHGKEY